MTIPTQMSLHRFIATDPDLHSSENGVARLYARTGIPQFRQSPGGSVTELPPTFHASGSSARPLSGPTKPSARATPLSLRATSTSVRTSGTASGLCASSSLNTSVTTLRSASTSSSASTRHHSTPTSPSPPPRSRFLSRSSGSDRVLRHVLAGGLQRPRGSAGVDRGARPRDVRPARPVGRPRRRAASRRLEHPPDG